MLHSDYLVRMLMEFAGAILRSMQRAAQYKDPQGAAELLDAAIGESVDMDGATLLALAPESIAQIMQVSGTDPAVTEYVSRSLMLSASYYAEAGQNDKANLRAAQAQAVAKAYGHDISDMCGEADNSSLPPEMAIAEEAMKAFVDIND